MQKIIYFMATLAMLSICFILLSPSPVDATTIALTTTVAPTTSSAPAAIVTPAIPMQRTVTLWLQATDSCERALPGASFSLVNASGQATVAPVTRGIAPVTIRDAKGACPLARGSCVRQAIGCTRWQILVPATGSVTYRIVEDTTKTMAHGLIFPENPTGPRGSALLGFVPCTGGSACHSESAIVTVNSTGSISAVVKNVAPDRTVQTYGPFTGMRNDPVLFHNYGVGSNYKSDPCVASAGNVQMNYGTGTQSTHCRYVP
jgi:hypothetical protein